MGRLDGIKSAFRGAWDWLLKIFRKATLSVEHVESIEHDLRWFKEQWDTLTPEARIHVDNIMASVEKLKEIWGI